MDTSVTENNNSSSVTAKLKSLLSLSFTCIKGFLSEEKEMVKVLDNLAQEIKTVETDEEVEKIRTQYRRLILQLDEIEERKKSENDPAKAKKDYGSLEKEHDSLSLHLQLIQTFAEGTRHLCDSQDLRRDELKEVEANTFQYSEEKVKGLIAHLKSFFLGKVNEIEVATKERAELKNIIKVLSGTVATFSSENDSFGVHLKDYAEKISQTDNLDDLVKFKGELLNDTKKLVEKSEQFRSKVSSSEENLKKADLRIKALEEEVERVKKESAIDPLTKVYNRGYFDRKMSETVDYFTRYETDSVLVMLDIDFFKKFNDNYGHQVGDKVLQIVASLIKKNTRKTDFLFRYGGEEFSVILTNSNIKDGKEIAEIFRIGVKEHEFKYQGKPVSITMSLGLTLFKKGDSPEKVIERADKALYQAKEKGRDRVEVMY